MSLDNTFFVFSQCADESLQKKIEKLGGVVQKRFSDKTTHVLTPDKVEKSNALSAVKNAKQANEAFKKNIIIVQKSDFSKTLIKAKTQSKPKEPASKSKKPKTTTKVPKKPKKMEDFKNTTSVKFLDLFLEKFHNITLAEMLKNKQKNKEAVAFLNKFDDHLTLEETKGIENIIDQRSAYLSATKTGKFQYLLRKYQHGTYIPDADEVDVENMVKHPDNNDHEYPPKSPIDKKMEKAIWKMEKYDSYCSENECNIEDFMTDTTGDWEFYTEITQRKYDLYYGLYIVHALKHLLDKDKCKEYIETYMGFHSYEFTVEDMMTEYNSMYLIVKDIYEVDIAELEF
jgi:hypothetical protein